MLMFFKRGENFRPAVEILHFFGSGNRLTMNPMNLLLLHLFREMCYVLCISRDYSVSIFVVLS